MHGVDSDSGHDQVMCAQVTASGLMRLTWGRGIHITEQLALDAIALVDTTNGGLVRPLLVDIAGVSAVSRDARIAFAAAGSSASRIALLGSSAVDRVLANFTLGATTVRTQYFTSGAVAEEWLLAETPNQ